MLKGVTFVVKSYVTTKSAIVKFDQTFTQRNVLFHTLLAEMCRYTLHVQIFLSMAEGQMSVKHNFRIINFVFIELNLHIGFQGSSDFSRVVYANFTQRHFP